MTWSFSGFNRSILTYQILQYCSISTKIYCIPNTNDGSADKPWLFQHQIDKLVIVQLIPVQTALLEARASEIKHIGSWFPLEQRLYLSPIKGILEEIAFVNFHSFLRKKLLRLPTGISFYPAIEVYLFNHFCFSFRIDIPVELLDFVLYQFLRSSFDSQHFGVDSDIRGEIKI